MKNTRSRELISFLQQIIFIFLQKIIYNYSVTHWKTFCYLKVTILPNNEPTCILTLTGDYTDLANTMEKGIRISGCEASEIWLLISQNWRNLFFSFFCYFVPILLLCLLSLLSLTFAVPVLVLVSSFTTKLRGVS